MSQKATEVPFRTRLRASITAGAWEALGWSVVVDPFTAQAATVQVVQMAYRRFIAEGATGIDPQSARSIHRSLAELAGLEPMYAIEDRTTEQR